MDVKEAAQIIKDGGVVAFPTETVFGLGADAFSHAAVEGIYAAKERPTDNPCIVHVTDAEMLLEVVSEVPENAKPLIEAFWPGPLTLILPKSGKMPDNVVANLPTVAVRIPDHEVALALIKESGVPIAAPSANKSGRPSPTTVEHVKEDFPNIPVLDGKATLGVESTVVALDGQPRVLRLGAVTLGQLREHIPNIEIADQHPETAESPGMKHHHYAPDRPLVLFSDVEKLKEYAASRDVVVLCKDEHASEFENAVNLGSTDEEIAHNLYGALRTHKPGTELCALGVEKHGLGRTIMDRLERAAEKVL